MPLFTFLLARRIWSASQSAPFATRINRLHEACEEVHGAATRLFWPLIALHLAGALKRLILDRETTLQRMIWVKRPEPCQTKDKPCQRTASAT